MGGVPILKGIIDRLTNQYYPWSMRSLAQISNEHLTIFYEDIVDEFLENADIYNDITRGSKQIIFGNPMPAFFPIMFKNFKDQKAIDVSKNFLLMLNNYTIGPEF